MTGVVTRSRAVSEGSDQKTVGKKKTNLTRTLAKRKPAEKQKSIGDESPKKKKTITSRKRSIAGTSKSTGLVQTNLKLGRSYISLRRVDSSTASDKSVLVEETRKTAKTRKVTAKVVQKKRNGFLVESINKSKDKIAKRRARPKKTADTDLSMRQMSLKESLLNQSKRPRSILKSTKSEEKSASSKKPKVPVYKSVPLEDSQKDTNEIYDFKYDDNDSKERLARKKKKRTVKKTRFRTIKKPVVDKKITKKVITIVEPVDNGDKAKSDPEKDKPVIVASEASTKEAVQNVADETKANENSTEVVDLPAAEPDKTTANKPVIRAVEELSQKVSVVKDSAMDMEGFRPFRPTNVFNRFTTQNRSMTNHSLLEKSLSPIAKVTEEFDPGSPWRPPPLISFSQVKSLFQSTPQLKYDISGGLLSRARNDSKHGTNILRSKDVIQKNSENLRNSLSFTNEGKKAITQRRFGTVITNLEHSVQSDNPAGHTSEKMIVEQESPTKNVQATDSIISNANNTLEQNNKENRENIMLNYQTPKKTSKTVLKRHKPLSPLKQNILKENFAKRNEQKENIERVNTGVLPKVQKENVDPQPGPSGLQTSKSPLGERTNVLKENAQTNKQINILRTVGRENIEPQPGPSGLQSRSLLGEQINVLKENTQANKRVNHGVLRAVKRENAEPQPGPSGLESRSPLKTGTNTLKENRQNIRPNVSLSPDKENIDPQPGPSGLRTSKSPRDEHRVLRQSNLNSFLNLTEMPESTTIVTRHGIFGDNFETPISSKITKKLDVRPFEISNAFGFVEDDEQQNSDENEAINQKATNMEERVKKSLAPVRLPAKDIRNHLQRKIIEEKIETEKRIENIESVEPKGSPAKRRNKIQFDIANFSDTFDVLSETEVSESTSNVPLFADLEPSRFTQPPKHLYKRKRAVRFNFADDNEEEDQDSDEEHRAKRRKNTKTGREDHKRLQEWIKNVNQTFDEIDHYDLLVE